jgi:molybdopterin-guanine dinucleotide biosynthesis adapter protein
VLVEGYKFDPIPKLEVWRASLGKPLRCSEDPHVVAIATDSAGALPPLCRPLPVFALADCDAIATFVSTHAIGMPGGH